MKEMILSRVGVLLLLMFGLVSCTQKNVTTRESAVQFMETKTLEIKELSNAFEKILPKKKDYLVSVGIVKGKGSRLELIKNFGNIADPNTRIVFDDFILSDSKLDSALAVLDWTELELLRIVDLLEKSGCEWICSTEYYGSPIVMYQESKERTKYSYYVFPNDFNEDLTKVHGNSVGRKGFLKRVYVVNNYGSDNSFK